MDSVRCLEVGLLFSIFLLFTIYLLVSITLPIYIMTFRGWLKVKASPAPLNKLKQVSSFRRIHFSCSQGANNIMFYLPLAKILIRPSLCTTSPYERT